MSMVIQMIDLRPPSLSPCRRPLSMRYSILCYADVSYLICWRDRSSPLGSLHQLYNGHVGTLLPLWTRSHFIFRLNSRNAMRKATKPTVTSDSINLSRLYGRPTGSGNSTLNVEDKTNVHIHQTSWSDASATSPWLTEFDAYVWSPFLLPNPISTEPYLH